MFLAGIAKSYSPSQQIAMDFIGPRLQKIPGGGMPIAEKDRYVKDLKALRHIELLEVKERQLKLLADKHKLQKLPDKGQRVRDFCKRVEDELERRADVEETARLFSKLNIASEGKRVINAMEWTGQIQPLNGYDNPVEDVLDSDDEIQMDPLRIIAQRQMHEKKVNVLPPEGTLITANDIRDIESFRQTPEDVVGKASSTVSKDGIEKEKDETSLSERDLKTGEDSSPENGLENEKQINDLTVGETTTESVASSPTIVNADVITLDLREKLPLIREKLKMLPALSLKSLESGLESLGKPSGITSPAKAVDESSACVESNVEPHVQYLIEKTEIQPKVSGEKPKKEKFLPHRTTITNVHDPSKERARKLGKHWEVTAATPPLLQHNATQMLTLLDSVEIQTQYLNKMKALQEQLAIERLAARQKRLDERQLKLPDEHTLKTSVAFTKYRDRPTDFIENIEGSSQFDEEWKKTGEQSTEEEF